MDTIMLTWLTNLKEVALYNIALPIMQIFQSLIIFPTVFIPIASTLWQQGNKKQIGELTNGFITLITFLCWGIFIFTMILGKDIITILFSTRYTDASTALVILCVGIAFFALSQFFIGTLNSIEKTKQSALIILVGLIINLTLNYILIPILGLNGAATATAISYFIVSIISYIQLRHNIPNLTLDIKRTILCCIAGLFCTACMLFFNYISYTLLDRILFTGILGFIFLILTLPASIPIIVLIKNIKLQK